MIILLVILQFININSHINILRHNWDNNRPLVSKVAKDLYELQHNKCTMIHKIYGMNNYGKYLIIFFFLLILFI